ncbi:hypothetical protein GOP47_0017314, partial [Adiantum capillus-veneris]
SEQKELVDTSVQTLETYDKVQKSSVDEDPVEAKPEKVFEAVQNVGIQDMTEVLKDHAMLEPASEILSEDVVKPESMV